MERASACEHCLEREDRLIRLLDVQAKMADALKQSQILLRQDANAEAAPHALSGKEAELAMV